MAIEVQKYKNTGLEYIRGKERVIFKHGGVVVLAQDFDEWDRKGIMLAQVLGLAGKPGYSGFDFEHVRRTGTLQHRSGTPDIVEVPVIASAPTPPAPPPMADTARPTPPTLTEMLQQPTSRAPITTPVPVEVTPPAPVPISVAPIPPASVEVVQAQPITAGEVEAEKEAIHSSPLLMLIVIILVGLGAMVMSAYHIITYMHDGGRAAWIAAVTGVIMTLFSAIAFTAARHFFDRNKGGPVTSRLPGYCIGAAFTMFGVIVIFFAMFSTIKVNFDQFKAGDEAKIVKVVDTSSKVQEAGTRAKFVASELQRLDGLIKSDQAAVDSWTRAWKSETAKDKDKNADLVWQYWSKLSAATKALNAHQAERTPFAAAAMDKSNDVSSVEDTVKKAVEDTTVFGMFANLFGIPVDTLKFIVYVIPAVFYDLMCPFALTISFMLADERSREKRRRHKRVAETECPS
jgi:hypothetical protein